MRIQVEVEMEDVPRSEVLCDVEDEYGLVAVNEKEQSLIDDFEANATAEQLQALGEQIDAAWAEYRQEMRDNLSDALREIHSYPYKNGGW